MARHVQRERRVVAGDLAPADRFVVVAPPARFVVAASIVSAERLRASAHACRQHGDCCENDQDMVEMVGKWVVRVQAMATVKREELLGADALLNLKVGAVSLLARVGGMDYPVKGDVLKIALPEARMHCFNPETGLAYDRTH